MKNSMRLLVALFVGLWLAELHIQPTNLSDMIGLKSDNFLVCSQREELSRASRL